MHFKLARYFVSVSVMILKDWPKHPLNFLFKFQALHTALNAILTSNFLSLKDWAWFCDSFLIGILQRNCAKLSVSVCLPPFFPWRLYWRYLCIWSELYKPDFRIRDNILSLYDFLKVILTITQRIHKKYFSLNYFYSEIYNKLDDMKSLKIRIVKTYNQWHQKMPSRK